MNIEQFTKPKKHPFNMLDGLRLNHTYECESLLAWMLMQCIDAGEFKPIRCKHTHPTLVDSGLLIQNEPKVYSLTKKAKGLLYGYYGVE